MQREQQARAAAMERAKEDARRAAAEQVAYTLHDFIRVYVYVCVCACVCVCVYICTHM